MNDRHDIGKAAVEPLAEAICNLVSRNLPGPNSSREESFEWTKLAYFPECIHTIAIHRLDAITETFFSAPGSTWVSTLSDADVQRVIAPKELKYPTYRTKCGEVWLVINVDIGPMSTWFEYDALKITQPIRTPFQRVFVLRHFGGRLIELEVKR